MITAAHLTGISELIFPEVGAMSVGLLIMDKKVWHIGKAQVLLLLVMESAAGIATYGLVGHIYPIAGVLLAFVIGAAIILCMGTPMLPALAACLMPNVLGIDTPIYVLGVLLLGLMVIGVQTLLERTRVRTYTTPLWVERQPTTRATATRWLQLLMLTVPMVVAAQLTGWHFVMAPPLIITLIEFCNSRSGFRHRPWQILGLLIASAIVGAGAVMLCLLMGITAAVGGTVAAACVLLLYKVNGKYFAPAMAVAILAQHVPTTDLMMYPIEIGAGAVWSLVMAEISNRINKA